MGYIEIAGSDQYGGDQLVGDDLEEMFGAAPQDSRALAAKRAQASLLVKDKALTKWRKIPVGIDSGTTLITAGSQQTITLRPQAIFRPYRLVVSQNIMADFVIDDVKVGSASQFVATGSLPADMFGPGAVDTELKGDTVQSGFDLIVIVTNTSGASRRFRGGMVGFALLP